jgi:L-alanine-DL-glutamate epimerase-like enolase superfamily enzyme
MDWTRRDFCRAPLALPVGAWLANYMATAAPSTKTVKITAIKTLKLDNVGDGCPVRIETDAGLVGYGESGICSKLARDRIESIERTLIGQDLLAIERHFYMMSSLQYSFVAHIPTISAIDIALWDLAGKTLDKPLYGLLVGPIRAAAPIYSHGNHVIHSAVAYSGGITGCRKIADYAALARTPVGLPSGPCSLVRFDASVHLAGAIQNFSRSKTLSASFAGSRRRWRRKKEPVVRKSVMQFPEGAGLGLKINEIGSGNTWPREKHGGAEPGKRRSHALA